MNRRIQERMLYTLIELNESALFEGEAVLHEKIIKDLDYQQYLNHARFAGTTHEAAKRHQKAGFRAAELGHHKRAERHFNLAGEFHDLHRIGIVSTPSMLRRGLAKKQYKV